MNCLTAAFASDCELLPAWQRESHCKSSIGQFQVGVDV
jgi:hypothetical protein